MLPLAIYLTEEFRLLDRRTLRRALDRYFLKPDTLLIEQLQEMFQPQGCPVHPADIAPVRVENLVEPISRQEADHNFNRYLTATEQLKPGDILLLRPEMLDPRYQNSHFEVAAKDLIKRLVPILHATNQHDATLLFDTCNEQRLNIQLQLFQKLIETGTGTGTRLGLSLLASSKRLIPTLGWLESLCRDQQIQIAVRLLPYDSLDEEVIEAQRLSLSSYPILRTEEAISANYQIALRFLAIATQLTPLLSAVEFARAPGLIPKNGQFEAWLPNEAIAPELGQIPSPVDIFDGVRKRAPGIRLEQIETSNALKLVIESVNATQLVARSIISGDAGGQSDTQIDCLSPSDTREVIGKRWVPSEDQVRKALAAVANVQGDWDALSIEERRKPLINFADMLVEEAIPLAVCLARETGKPIRHALEELRDAADLAYYYIGVAEQQLQPIQLYADQFTTHLSVLHGRGLFLLTPSPEQPIAETAGNLVAALITGNGAVVKPPESASLSCSRLFELALRALIPAELIAFLPGGLREIGNWLLEDYRIDGVVYTGLGIKGARISQQLASRPGSQLIPIMVNAEGQNIAMIDSDQDSHQLVRPLLEQALSSAGQYPLSSHVIYLEQSIAESFEKALVDALPLIMMGDPLKISSDLGPMSSQYRMEALHGQIERMRENGRLIAEQPVEEEHQHGLYIPPTILRLYTLDELQEVIPGPLLFVIRFDRKEVGRVIHEINRTGYGLALSLFSKDEQLQKMIEAQVRVGNLNFNHPQPRGSAGALPTGGIGPSGNGPQIGGPKYLMHFTCERTVVKQHR